MLYKYVGHENIKQVIEYLNFFIEEGTILASKPISFNDPAEFKIIFDFDAEPEIIKEKYFSDNPSHSYIDFKKWYESFDEQYKWHMSYTLRETYLSQNGTICLTRDNDNYLMWSHYAHSHTGFCIGFDDSIVDCIDDYAVFGDVNYTNSIPRFNYFTENLEKFAAAMFLHKGLQWAYEKNLELLQTDGVQKKIDKSLIKEIVIGCRAPYQLQEFVSKTISTDIKVSKMGLSHDTYSLRKLPLKKKIIFKETFRKNHIPTQK